MNRPLARMTTLRVIATMSTGARLKWCMSLAAAASLGILAYFASVEMQTSRLQARYLARLDRGVSFTLEPGASDRIHFPSASSSGPYDIRLGYAQLSDFEKRLSERGYAITRQARLSPTMISIADRGLFLPYAEKDQTGLQLFDMDGEPLFGARYPALVYPDFNAIPPLVVSTLTFIEDRNLLDATVPQRNPAIDWGRFSRALSDQVLRFVKHNQSTPGGSTLATQIEKFRHSPDGRTATPPEKLRQIASASVRAYLDGEDTLPMRHSIVVRYLNTVPLAAQPRVGEIEGLGDGLAAWYGRDFREVNELLSQASLQGPSGEVSPETLRKAALAFKQTLSLLIAQRAPSYYLVRHPAALERLTDSHLRVLAANGVISQPLRDAALAERLELQRGIPSAEPATSYVSRKAVTLLRTQLMESLGVGNVYDLDRLDLSAHATLNKDVQAAVSEAIERAGTVEGAKAAGLYGADLLRPGDDPSKITFSFTLFERRGGENLLRVQTDSVNQPFDINRGARLNLGSTAKLRTIVNYLQIVATLHQRYATMPAAQLRQIQPDPLDELTRWAVEYLASTSDRSLPAMLEAAVERKYSASPEAFSTGGGMQVFSNFEKSDNGRILTVHEAFKHSVNLVFVRLMRDIVHYEMVEAAGPSDDWTDDTERRERYLTQFVDQESLVYLHRFYLKYGGKSPDAALDTLIDGMRKSPPKLATALRSVAPDEPRSWFDARMRAALKGTPDASLNEDDLDTLYNKYGVDKFNLNDRGYIARVHPLELWMLNYLRQHPNASERELKEASREARVTSYAWLFKTRQRGKQDRRVRRMVELEAYERIAQSWRALGYPFATVTPSYGAAVGASGDRPDSLAQLIGIVANDGRMLPPQSIESFEFASGTPFETHFSHIASTQAPQLQPEIAVVVQGLLRDVVQGGTGTRLAHGLPLGDGRALDVYGKTGTGDQRFEVYAPGGRVIESRKVNRTGTFVFVIDNRFFGTLSAITHEPYAAHYSYTSALAVQLLKSLGPKLAPLVGPRIRTADKADEERTQAHEPEHAPRPTTKSAASTS
ncbi:MAG TPA: transglycosylase domain-containing protein [Trinickia sp.]|uniref:transglycosylase domain-containing protein n=1 Tax=Trinickia sp. TaxID=2571163 RepID=UPI002D19064C|nr:transglycosylase domain-containing protein [Trinickia sp.]HTI17204.1 transglycosylase domain-containing protein [Trinickia sp.]